MSETQDDHGAGNSLDLAALWPWIVFPLLPLLGALGLLHLLYGPVFDFATAGFTAVFVEGAGRSFLHFQGLLVYASVGFFHVSLCLFAGLFFAAQIRALPAPVARRAWMLAGLLLLILLAVAVVARFEGAALQLSYRNTCELLSAAGVAPHVVPRNCQGGPASPLLWLASLPTLAGLLGALMAAVFSSTAMAPLPEGNEAAWRMAFARRVKGLQRAFTITSGILVTSTVSIMLFLKLPLDLAADEATKAAVSGFAQGMTIFWGSVFTLSLVAIFAPAAGHLLAEAQRHEAASGEPEAVSSWLHDDVAVSIPRQLGNLATLLAPLLVGPVGSLLQKLAEGV